MAMEDNLGPQFDEHVPDDGGYDDSFARNLRPQRTPGGLIAMPHVFAAPYLDESSPLIGKRSGGYSTCCSVIARRVNSALRASNEWGEGQDLQEAEGEGGYSSMRAALAAADYRHEKEHETNYGS
jgi:hypothetical protein